MALLGPVQTTTSVVVMISEFQDIPSYQDQRYRLTPEILQKMFSGCVDWLNPCPQKIRCGSKNLLSLDKIFPVKGLTA